MIAAKTISVTSPMIKLQTTIAPKCTGSMPISRPIGILQDLQGPKIRVGTIQDGAIEVSAGDTVRFVPDGTTSDYLQLGLGPEETRRWVQEETTPWAWTVEWYQPGVPENWRVWVGSGGRVTRSPVRA